LYASATPYGHGGHGGSSFVVIHNDVGSAHGGHGGDGGYGGGHDGGYGGGHGGDSHDYYHHPSYNFEYGVTDGKTGHEHTHSEHRDGDTVHGKYTVDEADGTKRIVTYSANKKTGFTATVEKVGHATHDAGYGGGHGGSGGGHGGGGHGGHY
jgi:Insect cuticle protein